MSLNHKRLIFYPAKQKDMFLWGDENKLILDLDIFRQSFPWNADT